MKRTRAAAGISFFCILLSLSAYLFHWRVSNEPGAEQYPILLILHYALLAGGGVSFIAITVTIARSGSLSTGRILLPVILAALCYLPVLLITLLMMV